MARPIQNPLQQTPARPRAFTLIELLVVIAVMSLLTAIMLPSYAKAREEARRTICLANMKNVGQGLFAYGVDARDRGPLVMLPVDGFSERTLISSATIRQPVNMGHLVPRHLSESRALICPSQKRFNHSTRHDQLFNDWIDSSYVYAVHIPAGEAPYLGTLRHLALSSDNFVTHRETGAGIGRYAHRIGYNVLYTDGSVSWYKDPEEKIWQRNVQWDDETDEVTYDSIYPPRPIQSAQPAKHNYYAREFDVFRVWYAFCYNKPVKFYYR